MKSIGEREVAVKTNIKVVKNLRTDKYVFHQGLCVPHPIP